MNTKENDWLLNNISNPNFSITDFREVGLNVSNTSLENPEVYKNIPQITENPIFQTDGKFDEAKFDNIYKYVAESYNQFADDAYKEDILKQASFHRDNIFAEPETRRKGPDITISREANPLRQKRGINRLNLLEDPTMSVDEVAQTQKVLANPVAASKGADPIWHESPNDSFWTDFWDTRVLAQWDFDADKDGNPTSDPSKVVYKKGTLKLNDNGTYYYENLDGRDVYGRKVLSKLNTLTTDGSVANKYDFFDSDDIEKSIAGTTMRNVASIAPMFLSPWFVGAKVGMETIKLMSSIGKVFTGSDNKFLSSVEGFMQSLEPTTSEYGQNNTWSMENFINMAGDVFTQLYEQRWIFKYAPALFNNGKIINETNNAEKLKEFSEKYQNLASFKKLMEVNPKNWAEAIKELQTVNALKAGKDLEKYVEEYNKIGGLISKAYMTGVTVQSAYGEAKEQGASDLEAALLTLGYAAGEYAILNSKLGEWILPELRMDKEKMKQMVKAMSEGARKTADTASKVQKAEWAKEIFKMGKDIAKANYSIGKSGLKATAANALGEGFEETSEEVLYDFVKSLSNLGSWLAGSDTRLTAWDNMLDRYGMSFVGGIMGGAMFDALPNLRAARQLKGMTSEEAYQQMVFMARNGTLDKFIREVDKHTWGNKHLSAINLVDGVNGKVWAEGTETDNQDLAIKQEVKRIAKQIQDTINANNDVSDSKFMDINTLSDLRYLKLKDSTVMQGYIQDYNSACVELNQAIDEYNSLYSGTDKNIRENENNPEFQAKVKDANDKIKAAQEKKLHYINGDLAPEIIYNSLFEMSEAVSSAYMAPTFIRYAENKTGKKFNEIAPDTVKTLQEEYKGLKDTNAKDQIKMAANLHKSIGNITAPLFEAHSVKYYEQALDSNSPINILNQTVSSLLQNINKVSDSDSLLQQASEYTQNAYVNTIVPLIKQTGSPSDVAKLESLITKGDATSEQDNIKLMEFLDDFIINNIEKIANPIIKQGYINPEIKNILNITLDDVIWHLNNSPQDNYLKVNKLEEIKKQINKLSHSNLVELLDSFIISTTDSDIRASKLLDTANDLLREAREDISDFRLGNETLKEIKELGSIIDIFKAQILSARVGSKELDNLYGLNSTINKLDKESHLAEIDSNIADAMLQDLSIIESKLNLFGNIVSANVSKQLSEQERTGTNKNILIYKRIKEFCTNLSENWNGKLEFEGVLSSLSTLERISQTNKLTLSDEELKNVEQEIIKLDDGIYDFFNTNKDKLANPEVLSEIINTDKFNFFSENNEILNSESTFIDDNAIVWYLASRAAVKASDFYGEYKNVINNSIAPIPIQELSTYLGYASILNGQVIEQFCDAVNFSLKKLAENTSDSEWDNKYGYLTVRRDAVLDSKISPRFSRITFIEGIAGSGKTSAVLANIIALLKKYHPEVLNNVWLAHAEKSSADSLKEHNSLDKCTTFNREGLMKVVSPEWKKFEDYDTEEVTLENNTKTTVSKVGGDVYIDDDNITRTNFKINKLSTPPSIIFIDEVSRYTTTDLDLIQRFSKEYSVPVIVFGDLDQSKAIGKHIVNKEGKSIFNEVELFRNNFIRSPKLGVSMRKNNYQVDVNVNFIRKVLNDLRSNNYNDLIPLHYYQDENSLCGTKLYTKDDYSIELVKADIDLMIKGLSPGEKIGFMYYDTDTEIYKLLSNSTYKDKVDFMQGNSSQGLESKYYIIDDSDKLDFSPYWSDIYTGITRAKQGSLLLHTKESYNTANSDLLYKMQDSYTSINELSPEEIKKYSDKRRTLLESLELTSSPTKIISSKPEKAKESSPVVTTTPSEGLKSQVIKNKDSEGKETEEIVTNNGLPSDEEIKTQTTVSNQDKPAELPALTVNNTSDGKRSKDLNLLLYTFPTFETGTKFDSSGKLIINKGEETRIDSYFGLNNIESIPKTEENYDKVLGELRSTIFNTKDKNDLISDIKDILNLEGDVYCTFAFKSSTTYEAKDNKYNKFFKNPSLETLKYIFSKDKDSKKPNLKTLSIIIGHNNKDVLELPLAVLPNIDSVLKNKEFEQIREKRNDLLRANPSAKSHEVITKLITFLKENPEIPGANPIINLLEVYNFNSNGIFYIEDPNWTLAQNLQGQGPTITNMTKGLDYRSNTNLKYTGEWITLDELSKSSGVSLSSIKISPKGVYSTSTKTINFVKPGHPFIFISYDSSLKGNRLEEYYYKQLEDDSIEKKVKLVYVVPPKVSILEYFDNLLNIFSGNKSSIKRIGNDFTAFRILYQIMNQPGFKESDMNYNITAYPQIYELVEKLHKLDDINEQIKILNEEVDIKGLNRGITAKEALQNYLLSIVYPPNVDNTSRVFQESSLKAIEGILKKDKNIDGIFYNVAYSKESPNTISLNAVYDLNSYTIDGHPFMVNGKIDSPAFYGDMSNILESIVSKIVTTDSYRGSSDNNKYLSGNSRIGSAPAPTLESYTKSLNIVLSPSILEEYKNDLNINLDKDSIIKFLKNKNHLIIPIGDTYYVSTKVNNPEIILPESIISDVTNVSLNSYKFKLSLQNGNIYNGEFNIFENQAVLTKEDNPTNSVPPVLDPPELNEESRKSIGGVMSKSGLQSLGQWSYSQYKDKLKNMVVTSNLIKKCEDRYKDFMEGKVKEDFLNLIEYLKQKLPNATNNDNSCPVQIKIKF